MLSVIISSLESIEEEKSPYINSGGLISLEQNNSPNHTFEQKDIKNIPLSPLIELENTSSGNLFKPNNESSPISPISPLTPNSLMSNEEIEHKKSLLLQKYRSSSSKKGNSRIFQNKLKFKLRKIREGSYASNIENNFTQKAFFNKKSYSLNSQSQFNFPSTYSEKYFQDDYEICQKINCKRKRNDKI